MSFDEIASSSQKSAEVYRLSETDRDKILAQTQTLSQISGGNTDPLNVLPKKLEGLKKKEVTLSLHSSTLAEYIKVKRIPRGLRTNLAPNLLVDDDEFVKCWFGLCNQFSLDLMYLTVKHLQTASNKVRDEIVTTTDEIKQTVSKDQADNIISTTDEIANKLRENVLKIKLKKFARDTRDYEQEEVYSWHKKQRKQKGNTSPRNQARTQSPQAKANTSTESDLSNGEGPSTQRRPFLHIRRTVTNRPGRRDQRASSSESTRPSTRAWTNRGRGRPRRR